MRKIAIHSVPRSGSTWLGALLDAHPHISYKYQPLFSYELKGELSQHSTKTEIDSFFKKLISVQSDFLDQISQKEKRIVPTFQKKEIKAIAYKEVRYHHILSNLLEQDKSIKVIGLIRDPRAVLYSWWQAPKEFKQEEWQFESEWLNAEKKNEGRVENFYGYQKWKEVALLFIDLAKKYPQQLRIVNYRNLLQYTAEVMRQLMYFCELEMHQQQIDFINKSREHHETDAYAVYKVKKNDKNWRGKLPDNVIEFIEKDLKRTELKQFLK